MSDDERRERLISALMNESIAQRKRADVWRAIAEYGLALAMYGEHAPGGGETWGEVERRMRAQADADAALASARCEHGQTGEHELWLDHEYQDDGHGQAEHAPWCKCKPRMCPGPAASGTPDGGAS